MPAHTGYPPRRRLRRRRVVRRRRRITPLTRRVAMLMASVDTSRKRVDFTAQGVTGTAGTVNLLTGNIRGVDNDDRQGDIEHAYSYQFKYTLTSVTVNPMIVQVTFVRVILFRWKNPFGAVPGVGDVLQNTALGLAIVSPYQLNSRFNLVVYYDKVHPVQGLSGESGAMGTFFKRMRFRVLHTAANNNPNITSILQNGLFLLTIDDHAGTDPPVLDFYGRYRFTG